MPGEVQGEPGSFRPGRRTALSGERRPAITRFAPSPTGLLHLGHAYSAWYARERGHTMGLRIEDVDPTRCRPEFEEAILQDLAWLRLSWDGEVLRQSEWLGVYRAALARLADAGCLYRCFCTRREIAEELARSGQAPHGPLGPAYPGTCRSRPGREADEREAAGEPYALRLDASRALALVGFLTWRDARGDRHPVEPLVAGDFVVAGKETPTTYHLSVVVDDAEQGVTLVTRGRDLMPAIHPQRLQQALLGLPEPDYDHHPLVVDADGRRLAKRDRSVTLRSLREAGWEPEQVLEAARGRALG